MKRAITAIHEHILDGADLLIDFATLGEFGLEPERPRACDGRTTGLASGATHHLHDRAGDPERLAA